MVLELSVFHIVLGAVLCSSLTLILAYAVKRLFFCMRKRTSAPPPAAERELRDVLVGTLRNHMQLETCIKNKFYHIPALRLSPEDFPVHTIAIYQSNHKFGLDAGIRFYGEVKKCSLVPRYKITEIPKNSREMYYRFDIEDWKTLSHPIVTREGDFVNLMTTRFLLENSREIPELMLLSRNEYELYGKIRGAVSGEHFAGEIKLGDAGIIFDGGKIVVLFDGEELYSCTFEEYTRRPSSHFRQIMTAIEKNEVKSFGRNNV